MRSYLSLIFTLLIISNTALGDDRIDTGLSLLRFACQADHQVEIKTNAEGGLSIKSPIAKGVGGNISGQFYYSKTETQGFIKSLSDNINSEQRDKIRACMRPYLDKIVGYIFGNSRIRFGEPNFFDKIKISSHINYIERMIFPPEKIIVTEEYDPSLEDFLHFPVNFDSRKKYSSSIRQYNVSNDEVIFSIREIDGYLFSKFIYVYKYKQKNTLKINLPYTDKYFSPGLSRYKNIFTHTDPNIYCSDIFGDIIRTRAYYGINCLYYIGAWRAPYLLTFMSFDGNIIIDFPNLIGSRDYVKIQNQKIDAVSMEIYEGDKYPNPISDYGDWYQYVEQVVYAE